MVMNLEITQRTLIPVQEVLRSAGEHVSHKYDLPLVNVKANNKVYTVYLGKKSARHKKCYLLLQNVEDANESALCPSMHADGRDLVEMYENLIGSLNGGVAS